MKFINQTVGCITTRAMLIAYSAPGFGIFYAVHVLVVFIVLGCYFLKVEKISSAWKDGSQQSHWNIIKRVLTIYVVVICSSPFSMVDYRLEEVDFNDVIYYAVICIYNFISSILLNKYSYFIRFLLLRA